MPSVNIKKNGQWVGQPVLGFKVGEDNLTDELKEKINNNSNIELDDSLTQSGKAADAKAVGEKIENLTAEDVGARPADWMPTAEQVGARPADWMPNASDVDAVPTTRKVNGKVLSSDVTLSAADVGARPSTWTPTAAEVGAAPAGKTIMQGLGTRSWYRVGVLYVGHEQGHTAIAQMAIGGWFNDQNATPAIIDIAFDHAGGYLHKVFNTLRGTHITSVRLCRIDNRRVAIDVYYGGSGANTVYVTVYEIQGTFTVNSTFVDVSSSMEAVIATLHMTKAQTTQMDLLWVNATPGASFPAQTISLDLSAYDCVEVVASVGSLPNAFFGSTKVPIGQMGSTCGFYIDFWLHTRGFTVNATGIEFSSGQMKDLSNGSVYPDWDGRSVPYKIYGIKEGQ